MIRLQELELVFGQTDGRTDARTNGWTDRRDVGNSILDLLVKSVKRGKSFFKVHFLSIFSDLQTCMTHQINAFYTIIQIFGKICDFLVKY